MSHDDPAQAILDYLSEHPWAKDTAFGIARWWLGVAFTEGEVEGALEELTRQGWLVAREGGSQGPLYEVSPDRREALAGRGKADG